MAAEEEDTRGEEEVCWLAGPERLEAGEERRSGQAEVEVEARQGKEAGACCCERVTEERRTRVSAGGGWSSGPLLSCEALEGC